ncbi:hypothetical protein [Lysobacter gummosus]|uniref:Peptidase MA superfamily protein n=1 Tax=Lysobacter gummosus TaxID=262324 RepID=A0ABY3XGU5_9GAMM|nr:hypothetical protein [Lysobacter gummosus]ALN90336.1 peptidase MA superfamily protein [Lysobacter gummosus]UNP30871.1 hypothetical protein MOV92_06365 [Lysobacter gummosus]
MRLSLSLCALLAAAASPVFAQTPPPCPALPDSLPKTLRCIATEHGWFYADDDAEAAMFADAARQAAAKFERLFSRKASVGAVVALDYDQPLPDDATAALREHGALWVLPWVSAASMRQEIQKQIHRQYKKQNPNARMSASRSYANDFAKRIAGDTSGTVQHEVGHHLFVAVFWPRESFVHDKLRYGGPAPDWLDEGVAMLMEPAPMTEGRRTLFAQMAAGELNSAQVQPLGAFLNAQHPRLTEPDLPDEIRSGSDANRVSISFSLDGNPTFLRMAGYYAQTQVWIDFLRETGQRGTLTALAESLAAGKSLEDWLGRDGAQYGLPTSLPALNTQWSQWLQQHYPGPGAGAKP